MQKYLMLLFVALASFAGLASLAMPANAEHGEGSCASSTSIPLNLDSIPVKPVNGRMAVRGVAGDDDECGIPTIGNSNGPSAGAATFEDDDSPSGETSDKESE